VPPLLTDKKALALARSIEGSRLQFADAFRTGQAGLPTVLEFEAIVVGAKDYTQAYAIAFKRAQADGWIDDLWSACFTAEIVNEDFLKAVAAVVGKGRAAELQQLVDIQRGIQEAGLLESRLPRALAQVCRVEIDGDARGTGFLIRADLVMTAYHVVAPLLDDQNLPVAGSAKQLLVRFDYKKKENADRSVVLEPGFVCRVADPWLVTSSPCTKDELKNLLPEDEDLLDGFWDFAVIQLAEVPGVSRSGFELASKPVKRGHRLTIIQHANGRTVGMDTATVLRFLGKTDRYRMVHDVNAEGGSSGSPCLNGDFKVVGIHQAAMPAPANGGAAAGAKANRAVQMSNILGCWGLQTAPPAVAASVVRVLSVSTPNEPEHPVFGRTGLQDWVARSAKDAGAGAVPDRFLTVNGPRGCGKSFTTFIIKAMLPPSQHLVVECRASEFSAESSAVEFARKFLLAPLGATTNNLPSLAQADTSDNAWLNRQFAGDLFVALDQSRKGRMIWFVLDELDDVGLADQGQVRKLLDLMYQRAPQYPWIRFVLLGVDDVPVPGLGPATEQDRPTPASAPAFAKDVGDYLLGQFDNKGLNRVENQVRGTAKSLVTAWLAAHSQQVSHPKLLESAARAIVSFEQDADLRAPRP
jgi:hypothetical protein